MVLAPLVPCTDCAQGVTRSGGFASLGAIGMLQDLHLLHTSVASLEGLASLEGCQGNLVFGILVFDVALH